ncbi:MAG: hypothetical protein WCV84_04210 [Patescibacteria group bacterium]
MSNERTIQDVLDAINVFASDTESRFVSMKQQFEQIDQQFQRVDHRFEQIDNRFEQIDNRFEQIDNRFEQIDQRFEQIDNRLEGMDQRFERIEGAMVTKDYLDERLTSLRDELIHLSRRTNTKLSVLIEDLESRKVLDHASAQRILALEPFPQA